MPWFRYIILIIILLLHLFLFWKLRRYVGLWTRCPAAVRRMMQIFAGMDALLLLYIILSLILYPLPRWLSAGALPVFLWQCATLFMAMTLLLFDILLLPLTAIATAAMAIPPINRKVINMKESEAFRSFDANRRAFLEKGIVGLGAYSFIGAAAGVESHGDYELKRRTITIPRLPEAFKGFTIGMMSDIHSSSFMNKEDMQGYVKAMNEQKTDMIVVTGDFVNSRTEEVYPFAEAFAELNAPYGVYGCLGNHDFFAKDVEQVARVVDACGVKLLRNDAVKIMKDDTFFDLLGVDDIGRNTPPEQYMKKALAASTPDAAKILLCHKPYYFHKAAELGIGLTLSGHTHGGQIVFGVVDQTPISLATLASRYISGLYTLDASHLYVNNGIGYTGIPIRINCPAELTVLTLA